MKKFWIFFVALAAMACDGQGGDPVEFSYEAVSFTHPAGWKTETEELDRGYYVGCEKKDAVLTITFISDTLVDASDYVDRFLTNIADADNVSSLEHGDNYQSCFGRYDAVCADYSFKAMGLAKFYGRIYAFEVEGGVLCVAEQTESKKGLETSFATIEESFCVAKTE
ncbi:hypothetical protein FACS1894159_02320 [Bacteroidia bacterium]|nr:hypothetical protein FACS1894159_02320 [Bacteroidia bacterium]